MNIIRDIEKLNLPTRTAVAVGKFDGIHLGHRRLLDTLLKQKDNGLITVVITFDPPPEVFLGKSENKQLLTNAEKEKILTALGIENLYYYPMNETNAAMSAENFVRDILLDMFNMAYICAGEDIRFGKGGSGDCEFILNMSKKFDFEAQIVDKVYHDKREISSSYVREAVGNSDMKLTEILLGKPYSFTGFVTEGYRLGRTLGFPTANLTIEETKIIPKSGVYLSNVVTKTGEYKGISNIGIKPTIDGLRRPGIETYIYDYNGDLYGEPIEVGLLDFIRPEKKFNGIEELKAQVLRDIEFGLK